VPYLEGVDFLHEEDGCQETHGASSHDDEALVFGVQRFARRELLLRRRHCVRVCVYVLCCVRPGGDEVRRA